MRVHWQAGYRKLELHIGRRSGGHQPRNPGWRRCGLLAFPHSTVSGQVATGRSALPRWDQSESAVRGSVPDAWVYSERKTGHDLLRSSWAHAGPRQRTARHPLHTMTAPGTIVCPRHTRLLPPLYLLGLCGTVLAAAMQASMAAGAATAADTTVLPDYGRCDCCCCAAGC